MTKLVNISNILYVQPSIEEHISCLEQNMAILIYALYMPSI